MLYVEKEGVKQKKITGDSMYHSRPSPLEMYRMDVLWHKNKL